MRDRLGKYYFIGPAWFRLTLLIGRKVFAGSLYLNKRLLWLRPIPTEK